MSMDIPITPPQRVDPDRPRRRAVLVMWILAVLHLVAAVTTMALAVYPALGSRARQISLMAAFFGTPGAIHLLGAIFLHYHKFWAAMLGLLGAMIELAMVFALAIDWIGFFFFRGKLFIGLLITPVSAGLIVVAVYLIVNLARTMSNMQRPPIGIRRGFEPLGIKPITPAETDNVVADEQATKNRS